MGVGKMNNKHLLNSKKIVAKYISIWYNFLYGNCIPILDRKI